MTKSLKVTPPGSTGGTRHVEWEFLPETFCPGCGHKGVWHETGSGDYYVGEDYGCTACGSKGCMWDTSGGTLDDHVSASLKAAELAVDL